MLARYRDATSLPVHRFRGHAGAESFGKRDRRRSRQVSKADGTKCDRCWNYSTHVGEDKHYPTVCERCSAVLKEIEGNG